MAICNKYGSRDRKLNIKTGVVETTTKKVELL